MPRWSKVTLVVVFLSGIYLLSRLINLTLLPVFADEAIYIRWAQMIVHDPRQYLFLPLYDGKTPLFIWTLIPFLNLTPIDPLFASRLLSVVFGFGTMITLALITKEWGGSKRSQMWSVLLFIFLPFTLFMSRMGLIDMALTFFLGVSFWYLSKWKNNGYKGGWIYGAGLFWGLSILTKTSALYFVLVPISILLTGLEDRKNIFRLQMLGPFVFAGLLGLCFLLFLRISPLFPFLFQRSSDFAFTIQEIITQLPHIINLNFYRIGRWLFVYLTPGLWLTILYYFMSLKKNRADSLIPLLIYTGLFLLPFVFTGRLLSSRYFLPVIIWLIPLTAIALETIFQKQKMMFVILVALISFYSVRFSYPAYTDPGKIPFSHEDVVQYLTEWSSGYGIPEVRDFIISKAQNRRVVVATEGYFGTLPDGLLMYFDRSPLLHNIEIYGIGYPLSDLKPDLLEKARVDETYLVVNQHRVDFKDTPPQLELVASYPRPLGGPALLLFKINPDR